MKSFSVKPGARLNLHSEAPQCLDSGHKLQKEEMKNSTLPSQLQRLLGSHSECPVEKKGRGQLLRMDRIKNRCWHSLKVNTG